MATQGKARQGKARQGKARQGKARQGFFALAMLSLLLLTADNANAQQIQYDCPNEPPLGPLEQPNLRAYPVDTNIAVYLNYQSFLDVGFTVAQTPEAAVIEGIKHALWRWSSIPSARVRLYFAGVDNTKTAATANEMLIQGASNAGLGVSQRYAQAAVLGADAHEVTVFYRENVLGFPVIPWTVGMVDDVNNGLIDMWAILSHEIGHALGLVRHSTTGRSTVGCGYDFHDWRFGPNSTDMQRLRTLYGVDTTPRIRQYRSTDNGSTWTAIANNYATTNTITTTADFDTVRKTVGAIAMAWRDPTTLRPRFALSSNETFSTMTQAPIDIATTTVHDGVSLAGGGSTDQFMAAWTSLANDENRIRVRYSANNGSTWSVVDPPTNLYIPRALGTPGLVRSGTTWYLVFALLSEIDPTGTGKIYVLTSTNNGTTWGGWQQGDEDAERTSQGTAVSAEGDTNTSNILPTRTRHPSFASTTTSNLTQTRLSNTLSFITLYRISTQKFVSRPAAGRNNLHSFMVGREDDGDIAVVRRTFGSDTFTYGVRDLNTASSAAIATNPALTNIYLFTFER
jgi:hypothetical protein